MVAANDAAPDKPRPMKVLLALVPILAGCAAMPQPRVSPLTAEFDDAIGQAVATLPAVPGLAVAVYTRDGVYVRGFGVTDMGTREPATADTAFYIASTTKPLTALAIAILAARGSFDLDATLASYAPEANFPATLQPHKVTFRHLLSHTSGIENNPIAFRVAFSGEHDPELLWSMLGSSKPNERAPLGKFSYTNVGYNITTILTDRKLGRRWQDLLEREVFRPAGMTRSSAYMSKALAAGWSVARPHGYSLDTHRSERIRIEKTDQTMQSAGGVIMSARDAARWLELMVEDGRIAGKPVVPAAVVRSTRVPLADLAENADGFTRKHYGLGWYLGTYRDDAILQHLGGFPGARAHVSYLPGRHTGVAVFINDSTVSAPVVDLIAKFAYDRLADRADARTEFDAAVKALAADGPARMLAGRNERAARPWKLTRPHAAYAGRYVSAELGTMEITVANGEITARIATLQAVATPFTESDSIRVELAPFQGEVIRFVFDGGERPKALLFGGIRLQRQ
jgi:CubicO group peptidase (beta-lactamase class C family)